MTSVIVIGAGIGGLTAAARLARLGFQVTIYEKLAVPGGRTASIEMHGYRFDSGPTFLLMPELFANTFASLGERIEDHLQLVRLDPSYRVNFTDRTALDLTADPDCMRDQLESFEPGAYARYKEFMLQGGRHFDLALERFVGRNFRTGREFFNPANLRLIMKLNGLRTHAAFTSSFFQDPRLQAAFTFQNMYLGLSPYSAPATYTLLQYTEQAHGVWFPLGGMYRIIESLADIAEKLGVKIVYNAPIKAIQVNDRRVEGIILENGELISADIVLANADLPYVYDQLLPDRRAAARLKKKKYTSSALMFFWALRGERSPALLHHNMFLADQHYRQSFSSIFDHSSLPEQPSFYVCAPTRTDPNLAPPDGDALTVLVPVGSLDENRPQDWPALQRRARQTVISRLEELGIENISGRLVAEKAWTPTYYRDTLNLARGSGFGLSHNVTQVGYLRPHNRHACYRNLYFTGASTHPGAGLPIVLESARLVVERICTEN